MQSASWLHWTHLPTRFGVVMSPQTWFGGLLSPVQSVPVGASV